MLAHAKAVVRVSRVIPCAGADGDHPPQNAVGYADPAQHAAACIEDLHNITILQPANRRICGMYLDRLMLRLARSLVFL